MAAVVIEVMDKEFEDKYCRIGGDDEEVLVAKWVRKRKVEIERK